MATRQFNQAVYSIAKAPVTLWCRVSVGAAGAVTLQKWQYGTFQSGTQGTTVNAYAAATTGTAPLGAFQNYQAGAEGIFSVARTATGLWTVTLQDNYVRLLNLKWSQSIAGGTANIVSVAENTTISNMRATNGSIIGVGLLSSTATLADPTSGSSINLGFELQNATEP